MSGEGFRGVLGVPDGWELVEIGNPVADVDWVVGIDGTPRIYQYNPQLTAHNWPIIRKIEKPKQYRPFANAEEFKPHRDRWWKEKTKSYVYSPSTYSDNYHCGSSWSVSFIDKLFDDGTPFGVEVTE
jgi:hypothetical protein